MAAAPPEPHASTAAASDAAPALALDRCWSALPPELLARVLRLLPLDDRAACECVCPPWRAVASGEPTLWESLSFAALRRPLTAAALRALTARAGNRLRRLDVTAPACAALIAEDVAACFYTCNEHGVALLPLQTLPPSEQLEELVMLTPGVAADERGAAGVTLSWRWRGSSATCEHMMVAALPRLRLWSTTLELAHMSLVPGPLTDLLHTPFVFGVENLTRVLATFPPGEKHVRVNPSVAFPPAGPLYPPGVPPCPESCQGTPCDVRVCHLRGAWMPPLAEALARDETITVLDLSASDADNQVNLGVEAAQPLADVLRANRTLRKLHMWGHAFGDQGAAIIAQGLAHNTTLTELYMTECGIRAAGRETLTLAVAERGVPCNIIV